LLLVKTLEGAWRIAPVNWEFALVNVRAMASVLSIAKQRTADA
jgi:hypothetical protein